MHADISCMEIDCGGKKINLAFQMKLHRFLYWMTISRIDDVIGYVVTFHDHAKHIHGKSINIHCISIVIICRTL